MGYHQKHPYIDAQRVILKRIGERLYYWFFVRGKGCKYCCLRCAYYRECRISVEAEKESEAGK